MASAWTTGWTEPGAACRSARMCSEKNLMTSTSALVDVTPCCWVEPRVAIDVRRKMAVSFDFQLACGDEAYCCARGSWASGLLLLGNSNRRREGTHLEVGADVLGDDLRDLRLELLHERLGEVARRLPPRLAACAHREEAM